MSKAKLGAGLRAMIEEGKPAPVTEAVSFKQARPGRPPASGEDENWRSRPRAVLASGERRKAVVSYLHPDVSDWLKMMALKERTTVNALVGEAIDLLRRARGEHPFGER